MLRNPSDQPGSIRLGVADAFELPPTAATSWQLSNAYEDQDRAAPRMTAGRPTEFALQPFEVLVFDARAR